MVVTRNSAAAYPRPPSSSPSPSPLDSTGNDSTGNDCTDNDCTDDDAQSNYNNGSDDTAGSDSDHLASLPSQSPSPPTPSPHHALVPAPATLSPPELCSSRQPQPRSLRPRSAGLTAPPRSPDRSSANSNRRKRPKTMTTTTATTTRATTRATSSTTTRQTTTTTRSMTQSTTTSTKSRPRADASPSSRPISDPLSALLGPNSRPSFSSRSRSRSRSRLPSPAHKKPRLSPAFSSSPLPDQPAIPDWSDARIPFDCWTDIFLYAADAGAAKTLPTPWLLQAATTCRAFAEPALTAAYRCPSIRHASTAKRLAALLERPPSETLFNYRTKIEALHLDIHLVPQSALFQLIHPLNRLTELIIYTPLDQPPYRQLESYTRWHYPQDLFRALEPVAPDADEASWKPFPTRLKSWEWSGRLLGGHVPNLDTIARIHRTAPFSHLTRLSLTNFQLPSTRRQLVAGGENEHESLPPQDDLFIQTLAQAICDLGSLNHLILESCSAVNSRLLSLLPRHLHHLEIVNCWELTSAILSSFLSSHGSHLLTLFLLHNPSLDLAFLPSLADMCPHLQELQVNMSFFSRHEAVNDTDPMYDQALLPDQVPQWPLSLRAINMEHVHDWSVEAAEMFLNSLIDSATNLSNLRHISIKAMLDIPWQSRAAMRCYWRQRLESVFLRPFRSPKRWTSLPPRAGAGADGLEGLKLTRQQQQQQQQLKKKLTMKMRQKKKKKARLPSTPPSRRSGRIAAHRLGVESKTRSPGGCKSLRQQAEKPSYREPDTDEDETDVSESDQEAEVKAEDDGDANSNGQEASTEPPGPAMQPLCRIVNVVFDNQKVREVQYGMEDFYDDHEDDESEEEWDSDYDE